MLVVRTFSAYIFINSCGTAENQGSQRMGESLALWPWSEARPVVSRRGAASFKEGGLSPLQLPLAPLRWGLLFAGMSPAAPSPPFEYQVAAARLTPRRHILGDLERPGLA